MAKISELNTLAAPITSSDLVMIIRPGPGGIGYQSFKSPMQNFGNLTASIVSASTVSANTSMTSPSGDFTNITSSNISASGYISASSVTANNFYGTATSASYALSSSMSDVAAILSIPEANERMGIATLTTGTVTVSNTIVTATSRIFLTGQNLGTITVPAAYAISGRSVGTNFTILSSDLSDTSEVAWMIVEPA